MHLFAFLSVLLLCIFQASAFVNTAPNNSPAFGATAHSHIDTRRYFDIGSMISNFGKKATASHILIGPKSSKTGRGMDQAEAQAKLRELKEEIGIDPEKFAEAAKQYSSCSTSAKGGDLGEFGPGLMVKPVDEVCFKGQVGVVAGPVSSPFGQHLILVRDRK